MRPTQRRWIFLVGAAGLAAFYLWGLSGLPGFGNYVVVEAAVTALLLSFAIQAHKRFGTLDPQELASLKG